MSSLMHALGVDRLPKVEQMELVAEILESLDDDQQSAPISEELRQELHRRIAYMDAHPAAGSPWEEVEARILARLQK